LKLEGSDTQTQAVLTELKRIQQYFGKIKNIEAPPAEESRSMTVNQEAAARILKADLVRSPYEMIKTFQLTHQTV
jgi:exosome complex protein LRP1